MQNSNIFICVIISLMLYGCGSFQQKQPIIDTKIVKVKVPEEFLNIPPYGKKVDVSTSTQKEISGWILDTEERMYILEQQLKKIREYNEKSIIE